MILDILEKRQKNVFLALILFIVMIPLFSLNSKAQTNQQLYLNRIGFCSLEVGYDVQVVGDRAYVTNNDGLMIVDIQNPQNPQKIGEILMVGAVGFIVEGDIAYICSVVSGFVIANISDPAQPELLGQYINGAGAYRIATSGSHAYVTYFGAGFKIFNIEDPTDPVLLGEFSDTRSDAIQIKDNFVYFGNAEVGLKVINVSDSSTPQLVTTVSQTGGANDIHITNNLLFLACWGEGIRVLDISNPLSPLRLDSYNDNDGGEELGLVEKEGFLYVADNYGIEIFNVSNPNSIVEIAERTSDVSAAHNIDVDDDYIYVAQGGGLLILEVSTTPDDGTPEGDNPDFLLYVIIISVVIAVGGISIVLYFKIYRKKT